MNLAWVHYRGFGAWLDQSQGANEARGFFKTAYYLREALREVGSVVDTGEGVAAHPKLHLHVCPPAQFRPIPNKRNWLFTMWEGPVLPPSVANVVAVAERTVVPSRFCATAWLRSGLVADVVPLGVPAAYTEAPIERPVLRLAGRPVRFLWVGSKQIRKGWQLLPMGWALALPRFLFGATLTMKTVGDGSTASSGGVTVDQRDLDERELFELYAAHDVLLSTSFAEGFGLPVLEGMAAGCLAAAPRHSGLADFVGPETALVVRCDLEGTANYGGAFRWRVPSPRAVASSMVTAERSWGTFGLETIRRRGVGLARSMTWSATAASLLSLMADDARMEAA